MEKIHQEPHPTNSKGKLNALRAAVLGSNDGIVSVASIVVGVAGATHSKAIIFTAGLAGLVAGAFSMAAGEYVSVSSQRDSEREIIKKEKEELLNYPDEELKELQSLYEAKGLSVSTAKLVATELTAKDAFAAHADIELEINPNDLMNPWQATIASAFSFLGGAIIPLLAILIAPEKTRIEYTFAAVTIALIITGLISAKFSTANKFRATLRVVVGGLIAMIVTYSVGRLFGNKVT